MGVGVGACVYAAAEMSVAAPGARNAAGPTRTPHSYVAPTPPHPTAHGLAVHDVLLMTVLLPMAVQARRGDVPPQTVLLQVRQRA